MADDLDIPDNDDPVGDDFDVNDIIDGKKPKDKKQKEVPPYQMYPDSRIPVTKAFGSLWRTMIDSAIPTNDFVYDAWEQCFAYYNNHQVKSLEARRVRLLAVMLLKTLYTRILTSCFRLFMDVTRI